MTRITPSHLKKGSKDYILQVLQGLNANVDISPNEGQLFPLTKFIAWSAYYQTEVWEQETWEQEELQKKLKAQPLDNPDQVDQRKLLK